jgi:hypothetical protein
MCGSSRRRRKPAYGPESLPAERCEIPPTSRLRPSKLKISREETRANEQLSGSDREPSPAQGWSQLVRRVAFFAAHSRA